MSEGPRIDLALARAAGLPERAANDARLPLPGAAMLPHASPSPEGPSPDGAFSPLALLLARFLPPANAATPPAIPTTDEARLLQAYLQQRIVAVLRAAGVDMSTTLDVHIDADGALRLTAPSPPDTRYSILLRHPDIAQLAALLQRSLPENELVPPQGTGLQSMHVAAGVAREQRIALPWWLSDGAAAPPLGRQTISLRILSMAAMAIFLLAWWLFG